MRSVETGTTVREILLYTFSNYWITLFPNLEYVWYDNARYSTDTRQTQLNSKEALFEYFRIKWPVFACISVTYINIFLKIAVFKVLMQNIYYAKKYLHIKVAIKNNYWLQIFFSFRFLHIKHIRRIILIEARGEKKR